MYLIHHSSSAEARLAALNVTVAPPHRSAAGVTAKAPASIRSRRKAESSEESSDDEEEEEEKKVSWWLPTMSINLFALYRLLMRRGRSVWLLSQMRRRRR
jgi:hypothetical protein